MAAEAPFDRNRRIVMVCCAAAPCHSHIVTGFGGFHFPLKATGTVNSRRVKSSVLLFTSLLTIPLARQSRLNAALFTGLQIVGVTLDFLDNVLLLYLPLEPAQRIFERLAFLNANLCQRNPTSKPAKWASTSYWNCSREANPFFRSCTSPSFCPLLEQSFRTSFDLHGSRHRTAE